MGVTFTSANGYYYLDVWVLANVIQLATQNFCDRWLSYDIDPRGRQYDQMTQAARSITANIAEGSARHETSRETELRLLDVARGSAKELIGDYFNWLLRHQVAPWSQSSAEYRQVAELRLAPPSYKGDLDHNAGKHIMEQRTLFAPALEPDNHIAAANGLIITLRRLLLMLEGIMLHQLDSFRDVGGFAENMTQERLQARAATPDAPQCPACGKPMVLRVAKKGVNAGRQFWSCSGFPACNGTRPK